MKLKTVLDSYTSNPSSGHITTLTVVVQAATCDQSGIRWIATPAVTKTVDVAAGP